MGDRGAAYEFIKDQLHHYLDYQMVKKNLVSRGPGSANQAFILYQLMQAYDKEKQSKVKLQKENSILKNGVKILNTQHASC